MQAFIAWFDGSLLLKVKCENHSQQVWLYFARSKHRKVQTNAYLF